MAHQVTFRYYCGVVSFLEEDYANVNPLYYLPHASTD
jgi:hypothetical protein